MDFIKRWIMIVLCMLTVMVASCVNCFSEEMTHILGTVEYTVAAQVECKGNPNERFDNCDIIYYHYVKLEDRERVLLNTSDRQPKEEDMGKHIMKYLLSTTIRN